MESLHMTASRLSTAKFLAPLACVALAGCVTNYQADKVTEYIWRNIGEITLMSEKLSNSEYQIIARGSGSSREKDVAKAWNEFAAKIAAGRPFTKDYRVEDYSYADAALPFRHHAKRAVGKIVIVDAKP
jgi:hypothetical protein